MGGLGRLFVATLVAGVLVAGLLLPYSVGVGLASNKVTDAIASAPLDDMNMPLPQRTTITDANGTPIAWVYEQNRVPVPLTAISRWLPEAIVSTEDRRFNEHKGVDWRGTVRALLKNSQGELGPQGGSTITQQMVKNYRYLVEATTDAEKADAIAATPLRKLQEAKIAINLELPGHLSKDDIMGRYLNLVAFGPSVYGAQAAAQYFFGVDAAKLTLPQAALMAAMVNNPNKYNPFNPEHRADANARRNVVLGLMKQAGAITPAQYTAAVAAPLGTEQHPIPNGCLSAPNASTNGYFCTYVLDFLENTQKLTADQIARGGYTVKTTLDPAVMKAAKASVDANADPAAAADKRVANVLAVIRPGVGLRKVLALSANRPFGLDKAKGQTVQRLPTTFAPLGAGSTFKLFTAAEALKEGLGTSSVIDNQPEYTSPLAPAHAFHNSGNYPPSLPLRDALATSPNTAFVALEDQIGLDKVVAMSVAMGMKGYELPAGEVDRAFTGSGRTFAQEMTAQKVASFTLGVTPVSPTELANVGATLASGGQWCQPTPIDVITDRNGQIVPQKQIPCAQAVDPDLAASLTESMQGDLLGPGTAARAAAAAKWTRLGGASSGTASKTGTTEDYKSSAFLGFTPFYSGAVMTWDYLDGPQSICIDPATFKLAGSCDTAVALGTNPKPNLKGMSGGSVPAATWFDAMTPLHASLAPAVFTPGSARYVSGSSTSQVPNVTGQGVDAARATLTQAGFTVGVVPKASGAALNTVTDQAPRSSALPGAQITLTISSGPGAANGR